MNYKYYIICFLLLILSSIGIAQKLDSIACSKTEYNLEIIKKYLIDYNSDPSMRRIQCIKFLSNLTGIHSESDGDYFGQSAPTKKDYDSWLNWYNSHKNQIFWDSITKKVIIKKIVFQKKKIYH